MAKRLTTPHRPGERGWAKVKNRDCWRYGQEVKAIRRKIERRRAFVSFERSLQETQECAFGSLQFV